MSFLELVGSGLKPSTRSAVFETFQKGFLCRPISASVCAGLGAFWYVLQSDLLLVAVYAGFRGTWGGCDANLGLLSHVLSSGPFFGAS